MKVSPPLLWLPKLIIGLLYNMKRTYLPKWGPREILQPVSLPYPSESSHHQNTKAHRVHSWRLTIHAHCVALSRYCIHRVRAVSMAQWWVSRLCLELIQYLERKKKKKKGAISLAVIVMIRLAKRKFTRMFPYRYENNQTNFLVNKNNNKECPDVVGSRNPWGLLTARGKVGCCLVTGHRRPGQASHSLNSWHLTPEPFCCFQSMVELFGQ